MSVNGSTFEQQSKSGKELLPHDAFFKLQMEVKEKAASFIRGTFPEDIVERLNLDTLELSKSSFIDSNADSFAADVVYECEFDGNEKVLITLLFEHKSQPEKFPQIQISINI